MFSSSLSNNPVRSVESSISLVVAIGVFAKLVADKKKDVLLSIVLDFAVNGTTNPPAADESAMRQTNPLCDRRIRYATDESAMRRTNPLGGGLIDVTTEDDGIIDVMIFTRLKGDGDTAVDHIERPMAFYSSLVDSDFNPQFTVELCNFKVTNRNPD